MESSEGLVWFPDLILALNSAAHSRIAKRILRALPCSLRKTASSGTGHIQFAPPIMMSVTSTADKDTQVRWRFAQLVSGFWRKTDGHDASLFTHDFVLTLAQSRCTIRPLGDANERRLMWVFQVPREVIKDHNDIFNSTARSLILALIQISGAVASLAVDWGDSFEPE